MDPHLMLLSGMANGRMVKLSMMAQRGFVSNSVSMASGFSIARIIHQSSKYRHAFCRQSGIEWRMNPSGVSLPNSEGAVAMLAIG
jgi:transposase InsO family protein